MQSGRIHHKFQGNKMKKLILLLLVSCIAHADLIAKKTISNLTKGEIFDSVWKNAAEEKVALIAQPMALPRPKVTTTEKLNVKAVHDGKTIVFRLNWKDTERSEAGKLGEYSDAVAMQFPGKIAETPPPIFMGAKDNPVVIYHWRAQYQRDKEFGKKEMIDIYPNMNVDMYPMEFKDSGSIKGLDDKKREVYSHGKAAGNPQSFDKKAGVDEIFAEGYGTSSVQPSPEARAYGTWKNGEWTVIFSRPIEAHNGSVIPKKGFIAFAVWQGGKDEVGSRKSVTMSWVNLELQ